MIDLYAVLGVERDATAGQIRKAYRARVFKAHPDHGGSVEEFQLLTTALEVLSDKARRRQYNETGEFDGRAPDNGAAETMNCVAAVFHLVISQKTFSGDIVAAMRLQLRANIDAFTAQREQALITVTRQEKFAKRFRRKKGNGPNLLAQLALSLADNSRQLAASCQKEINAADNALAFLDDYEDAEAMTSAMQRSPMQGLGIGQFGRMW